MKRVALFLALFIPPFAEAQQPQECAAIRSEIARQQNNAQIIAGMYPGIMGIAAQGRVKNNIATLESRASELGCYAAFGNRPSAPERPSPSPIESCVSTCKANTSKTPEQCFDACNH